MAEVGGWGVDDDLVKARVFGPLKEAELGGNILFDCCKFTSRKYCQRAVPKECLWHRCFEAPLTCILRESSMHSARLLGISGPPLYKVGLS